MSVNLELTEREIFLTEQSVKRLASESHHQAERYLADDLRYYQLAALSGELTALAVKIGKHKKRK